MPALALQVNAPVFFTTDFALSFQPSGQVGPVAAFAADPENAQTAQVIWLADAENELKKIPFFVRGKAKRNTEKYAADRGVTEISVETLYEAKAHYAR